MPTEEPAKTNKPSHLLSRWKMLSRMGKAITSAIGLIGVLIGILVGLQALGCQLSFLPHPAQETAAPISPSGEAPADREITKVRIEIADNNLIGPKTIEAGQSPGFEPFVFTAAGRLGRTDPCNVSWKVFNNSDLVYTEDTRCEKQGSFSEEFWPSDLLIKPGTMKVVAAVTTTWGASKTNELVLKVK